MALLVVKEGKDVIRLERTEFEAEKNMRDMLLRHPDMIPIYEVEEDIRLLTVKRELRVFEKESDKFADAVSVDRNGSIYLVETKLFRNPDKRSVVSQVLSYGASLWSSSQGSYEFMEILDESCRDLFKRPFLELTKDFFGFDERGMEVFKDALIKNWDDGVFKFVVYMDRVGDDLKNLVTYINKRSRFDIYIVGVDFYQRDGMEIIIPKMYGVPDRKELSNQSGRSVSGRSVLTKEEYLASGKEQLQGEFGTFLALFEELESLSGDVKSFRPNISFGGSYTPRFTRLGDTGPFSLKANGDLQVYFNVLEDAGLEEMARKIREKLVEHGMLTKDITSRQPGIKMQLWRDSVGFVRDLLRTVLQCT
jgi:hypothetical protein